MQSEREIEREREKREREEGEREEGEIERERERDRERERERETTKRGMEGTREKKRKSDKFLTHTFSSYPSTPKTHEKISGVEGKRGWGVMVAGG